MINADTDYCDLLHTRQVALIERDWKTVDACNWEMRRRHVRAQADKDYNHGSCGRCGATLTVADAERCTQCGLEINLTQDEISLDTSDSHPVVC